jgi:hypothetical protein
MFSFETVCYDPRVGLNILLLDEASGIDMQPLMPSTKILQWQLGQKLQCKGVVPITATIEKGVRCAWSTTSFVTLVRPSS